MDPTLGQVAARLHDTLRGYGSVAVALSGGVDSAVVAAAAHRALGPRAVAFTAVSPSVSALERTDAERVVRAIGIAHEWLPTDEFSRPEYVRNAPDRCYHCKSELYVRLAARARSLGLAVVVNGTTTDDLGDYRPGLTAAAEQQVRSPLVECGFSKAQVRALAAAWSLPVADKPASPCLSSRVAHGVEATPERLARIEAAEAWLRARGLREFRVRYHADDLARIELPLDALAKFVDASARAELVAAFEQWGFRFVTLDLAGFRSGSLNPPRGPLVELTPPEPGRDVAATAGQRGPAERD